MNFVSTGVKEVTRRLRRQRNRLALANARKTVEKAETALGRHGWRALAADESVRHAYEELLRLDGKVEGNRARIAEIEAAVHQEEAARARAWREHEENLDRLERLRRPFQDQLHALQNRLAEHAQALPEQNAKRHALQVEQTALLREEKRARRRAASEAELAEVQQTFDARRTALAEQAAQLTVARSGVVEPMAAAQREIKEVRAQLNAVDKEVQAAHAALTAREREITLAIAERHKEIAAIRRQTARIESEKAASYLAVGRRLSEHTPDALPDETAADLFAVSQKQRQSYERLVGLETAWLRESQDANRQDLRIFNFVGVTLAVFLAIALLLVFRTPGKRDWLPSNTQAILTVDVRRFTDADFTRALQSQDPNAWQTVWSGLVQSVAQVPQIDVRRQVARITRALAPPSDANHAPVDCLLVEMRPGVDVDDLLRKQLVGAGGFKPPVATPGGQPALVGGLPMYEKQGLAVAQIGPDTLALGSPASVKALIEVRLGLQSDLKSDAQLFSEFTRLSEDSPFRLVSHRPRELTYLTDPLLNAQTLGDCEALGLTLDMHEPVSVVFVLTAGTPQEAGSMARLIQANPDQVLQLASAGPNLFIERPTVTTPTERQVEWRFRMTAPAARGVFAAGVAARVDRAGPQGGGGVKANAEVKMQNAKV